MAERRHYKYRVTGPKGGKYLTTTKAEAKKLTQHGGSFRKVAQRNPSESHKSGTPTHHNTYPHASRAFPNRKTFKHATAPKGWVLAYGGQVPIGGEFVYQAPLRHSGMHVGYGDAMDRERSNPSGDVYHPDLGGEDDAAVIKALASGHSVVGGISTVDKWKSLVTAAGYVPDSRGADVRIKGSRKSRAPNATKLKRLTQAYESTPQGRSNRDLLLSWFVVGPDDGIKSKHTTANAADRAAGRGDAVLEGAIASPRMMAAIRRKYGTGWKALGVRTTHANPGHRHDWAGRGIDFKHKYLNDFFAEKEVPIATWTIEAPNGTAHILNSEVVLQHVALASRAEKKNLAGVLQQIDYHNGDVNSFLKHLAGAIAANYQSEIF